MTATAEPSLDDMLRQRARASRDGYAKLAQRLESDRARLRALREAKVPATEIRKMERTRDLCQMMMVQFLAHAETFESILRGEP